MIQMRTVLEIADNSGAKKAAMIGVLGRRGKRTAEVGDIITASVKEALPNGAIKKGEVVKAVLVRSKSPIQRKDGSIVRFSSNASRTPSSERSLAKTSVIGR